MKELVEAIPPMPLVDLSPRTGRCESPWAEGSQVTVLLPAGAIPETGKVIGTAGADGQSDANALGCFGDEAAQRIYAGNPERLTAFDGHLLIRGPPGGPTSH